jgi:hypothetical protein
VEEKRIARSVADSLTRLREAKSNVASSIDTKGVAHRLNKVSRPNSPSSTLKKAGVALIVATPDPVTAVPGVALIVASYAAKRNEPAKLDDVAAETRKILRDIQSLSV